MPLAGLALYHPQVWPRLNGALHPVSRPLHSDSGEFVLEWSSSGAEGVIAVRVGSRVVDVERGTRAWQGFGSTLCFPDYATGGIWELDLIGADQSDLDTILRILLFLPPLGKPRTPILPFPGSTLSLSSSTLKAKPTIRTVVKSAISFNPSLRSQYRNSLLLVDDASGEVLDYIRVTPAEQPPSIEDDSSASQSIGPAGETVEHSSAHSSSLAQSSLLAVSQSLLPSLSTARNLVLLNFLSSSSIFTVRPISQAELASQGISTCDPLDPASASWWDTLGWTGLSERLGIGAAYSLLGSGWKLGAGLQGWLEPPAGLMKWFSSLNSPATPPLEYPPIPDTEHPSTLESAPELVEPGAGVGPTSYFSFPNFETNPSVSSFTRAPSPLQKEAEGWMGSGGRSVIFVDEEGVGRRALLHR